MASDNLSLPKYGPEEHGIPPCITRIDWFTQCETGSHSNTRWNRWNIFASYLANTCYWKKNVYFISLKLIVDLMWGMPHNFTTLNNSIATRAQKLNGSYLR